MRYEHLVQINDLERPDLPRLDRAQLWLGLVARAERPQLFDETIDEVRVIERGSNTLERELRRGRLTMRESVRLTPERAVEITAGAGTSLAGSVLEMRIEEPVPDALFLRFTYELRGATVPEDESERRALRQAYYFADLDMVRHIRARVPAVV